MCWEQGGQGHLCSEQGGGAGACKGVGMLRSRVSQGSGLPPRGEAGGVGRGGVVRRQAIGAAEGEAERVVSPGEGASETDGRRPGP